MYKCKILLNQDKDKIGYSCQSYISVRVKYIGGRVIFQMFKKYLSSLLPHQLFSFQLARANSLVD